MSNRTITALLRAVQPRAVSEPLDAPGNARTGGAAPDVPPAPKPGGVLAGLTSRASAMGNAIAHPTRPNVPTDINALSLLRVGQRGRPVLPHQRNEVQESVAMPPLRLTDDIDAASLATVGGGRALRKPEREMQHALGGFNPAAHEAASRPEEARGDGLMAAAQRRFPGGNPEAIGRLVADLRRALPATPAASGEVHAAQTELLLDALADVSAGVAPVAQYALERMQQGLSFEPGHTHGAPQEADFPTRLAWRTAQQLASTATGYDCARRLAGETWPPAEGGASRYAPRVWLRAADELVRATGCYADPVSVQRRAAGAAATPDTPAAPGAHAARIVRAAGRLWETGSAEGLTDSDKGALLAGRQSYFADGPRTPFAATTNRLARFVNHTIPRAASDRPELEPAEGEAAAPVASRRKLGSALVRPFGFRKTAVAGMLDGVSGASLGTWDKDGKALDEAVRGALIAVQDSLDAQAAGGAADGGGVAARPKRLQKDSAAIHGVVGHAELEVLAELAREHGNEDAHGQTIEYGAKLDDDTLDRIAARVAHSLDDAAIERMAGSSSDAGGFRSSLRAKRMRRMLVSFRNGMAAGDADPTRRANARKLVRKHLANGSDTVDAAKLGVWNRTLNDPPDDAVAGHFATIDRVALGKTITPAGTTIADYRDASARIIDALEGGGKAVITDGGQFGASTRGVTATAASFPLIAPRLNLQAAHGRQSVLEISRSTPAYKISFGTQRRTRYDAGAGLQLGHNFGVARVGGNIEGGYQWNETEQRTVDLSIARRLKDDDDAYDEKAAKTQLKRVNDYLFENAGKGRSGQALWNELGTRFYDSDDFSIAWNDQTGKLERAEAVANFRAGVKIGTGKFSARANALAGGVYQYVPRATLDTADASGQTSVESHRFGSGHRAGVQLGVSATVNDTLKKDSSGDPGDLATVSMLAPNVIGLEVPFHDSFHQAKVTLVRERGTLQTRSSNADIEVADFTQYKKALREDPAWRLAFGVNPGDPLPATPHARDAALDAGARKIERYLSDLSVNRAQNLKFVLRRRLREHAARSSDALDDRIATLKTRHRGGEADEIQSLVEQRDALLKRADSWLPTELLTIQTNDRQVSAGLRMGVQIAVQKGARGEHEVASLKLKPREADRMDQVWPGAPAGA